jgi:hypothetical protein
MRFTPQFVAEACDLAFSMSRATPRIRNLAERLMALETRGNNLETKPPVSFRPCEKLRPYLATLMGSGGFQALLLRALALAKSEVAWLHTVQVKADGTLEAVDGLEGPVSQEEMTDGCIILLTELLGLLVAFIGEDLTLRMVRDVWPKQSFDDLDFGKEVNI